MSKAVLLSIQPKWCELIASGQKTVEVRKTRPKLETPFKCYIYCTKDRWYKDNKNQTHYGYGKVIGEFVCDKVDCYPFVEDEDEIGMIYPVSTAEGEKTCLEYGEVEKYGSGKPLYFWHISDLVIYDRPKELYEFYRKCENMACEGCEHLKYQRVNAKEYDYDCEYFGYKIPITRPPQSWCYVEELRWSDA